MPKGPKGQKRPADVIGPELLGKTRVAEAIETAIAERSRLDAGEFSIGARMA